MAHIVAADAEERGGFRDRVMRLFRCVDPHRATQRLRAGSRELGGGLCAPRGCESGEVCHRTTADEQTGGAGIAADDLFDPVDRQALELDRGRRGAPCGEIRVQRGSEEIGNGGGRGAGSLHVAEHARVSVVAAVRHEHLAEIFEQLLERHALERKRGVELAPDFSRADIWIEAPLAHGTEVIGHRFNR
jgi:hypothetical protein